tara:strand:+ start:25970 stop:26665 length:696 start_codon:yes stop_codon:yes gene_type:complete
LENKKIKILVVDDDPDIIEIISYNLKKENYKVFSCYNGTDSIKIAEKEKPDLIILDVMMPGMDGIQVCEKLRSKNKFNNTIIMFLSARGEDFTHIAAYDAGADDFVNKPLKPRLLISKVTSLLRRINKINNVSSMRLNFKGLIIDKEKYTVKIKGEKLILPRKEFELLFMLSSNTGKVIKREEIMNQIWGEDVIVGDRTIDVHIRKLRKKIGSNFIKTIKGIGYKFISTDI